MRHFFVTCVIATGLLSFEITFFYVYVVWYVESAINTIVVQFANRLPGPMNITTVPRDCMILIVRNANQYAKQDGDLLLQINAQSAILGTIMIAMMLVITMICIDRLPTEIYQPRLPPVHTRERTSTI